eukprot:4109_1
MFNCRKLIGQICRKSTTMKLRQPNHIVQSIIRRQTFACALTALPTYGSQRSMAKNPLRCVYALNDDHIRIRSTVQAFDRMLDKISVDPTDDAKIPSHYLEDVKLFMEFTQNYCKAYHEAREEILYNKVLQKNGLFFDFDQLENKTQDIIDDLEDDHLYVAQVYQHMLEGVKTKDKDAFMVSSKSFVHLFRDHMAEEDRLIYPKCIQNLSEHELEQISQIFDDVDETNDDMLNRMLFISDELQNKYHPHSLI